jgi:hypothetical protein
VINCHYPNVEHGGRYIAVCGFYVNILPNFNIPYHPKKLTDTNALYHKSLIWQLIWRICQITLAFFQQEIVILFLIYPLILTIINAIATSINPKETFYDR